MRRFECDSLEKSANTQSILTGLHSIPFSIRGATLALSQGSALDNFGFVMYAINSIFGVNVELQ